MSVAVARRSPLLPVNGGTPREVADSIKLLEGRPMLPNYVKTALPAQAANGEMIYVTNESGGAVPAFFDGTNWRRVTDRAVVS